MTSTMVASVAGAPGVSTLVAAIAATTTPERPLLVVEAAPSGGVVGPRYRWTRADNVVAVSMETDRRDLWAAGRDWLGGSRILAGDPSMAVTRQAQLGAWLASRLPTVTPPVLIDGGRLDGSIDQRTLIEAVDRVWLLVDPTRAQVAAAAAIRDRLSAAAPVELLVLERAVGPGRWRADEVVATVGLPLAGTVPIDERAADVLCGHGDPWRSFHRSALLRTGLMLADRVSQHQVVSA